jgi:hypothetical protein
MTLWRDPVGWWCALGRPLARLPRGGAIALLLALLLALGWSSLATTSLASADDARVAAKSGEAIGDLELYRLIHERYAAGESYHAAAVAEQRRNDYPVRPFVTVRLPTLAWIDVQLPAWAAKGTAILLLGAILLAWIRTLEPLARRTEWMAAILLLTLGGAGLLDARVLQFHELVAGALLTLALGLYRPGRWWPALLAAAAALAIRELALPFLLLWATLAALERRWREAAVVVAVVALFAIALWFHAQAVAPHVLPGDPGSPGWQAFNGPQIALFALSRLTALTFLPVWLAAPLAVLPLLGWAALGGRPGLFASLWFAGFGLAMALFARGNNFYWVLMVLPAYGAGLAFVPRAIAELVKVAARGQKSQS